jgi:hypothetical protein
MKMPAHLKTEDSYTNKATARKRRGISHVITTIIISGVLLTILVVASYASTVILESQIASTEFEQAKSNMMMLDDVIQDVALRLGSGGYVQFNQRSGGIGIYEKTETVTILAPDLTPIFNKSTSMITLTYRTNRVPTSELSLRGTSSLIVNMTQTIGYLRVETGQGAQVSLDYNRTRVVPTGALEVGGATYNFIEITLIELVRGRTGGSDTVSVKVRNTAVNTSTSPTFNNTGSLTVKFGSRTGSWTLPPGAPQTVVIVSEVVIEVSIS